jgi:hypothetical protein
MERKFSFFADVHPVVLFTEDDQMDVAKLSAVTKRWIRCRDGNSSFFIDVRPIVQTEYFLRHD